MRFEHSSPTARLFHSPATVKPSTWSTGERTLDDSSSTAVDELDAASYARVLERRIAELEEIVEKTRNTTGDGKYAAMEAKCAALRAENARLKATTSTAAPLRDVTNGSRARESTPMRALKSRLSESTAAMAVENELRVELAKAKSTAAAESARAEKRFNKALETASENEEWLASALRAKCDEVEKSEAKRRGMDARMGELQDALRVSESRLREALNNLDEYRAEVKSSIKREKKHAKIMHDKYKACKRERAQLEAEVDALRELASTPPPDATLGSVSYTRAAESAVKIASFAMEYPSPFAAAPVSSRPPSASTSPASSPFSLSLSLPISLVSSHSLLIYNPFERASSSLARRRPSRRPARAASPRVPRADVSRRHASIARFTIRRAPRTRPTPIECTPR